VDTTTTSRSPEAVAVSQRGEPGAAQSDGPSPSVERPRWLTAFVAVLVVVDGLAMAAATLTAKLTAPGLEGAEVHIRSIRLPDTMLALATIPTWLVILALADAYDVGPFGTINGLWTRVIRAGAQLLAVVAVAYYVLHLALVGRGVLAAVVPLAVVFTLGARAVVAAVLRHARRRGRARRTALVAGSRRGIDAVIDQLAERPASGITPIDALVLGPDAHNGNAGKLPVAAGDVGAAVSAALARSDAEALIVTGGLARGQLRDIAWRLEGTGVELLVMPAPSELEELSADIRPVSGLPLFYVDR
jgi:FlaA1/EpsC-like NDP-sugar epimerase